MKNNNFGKRLKALRIDKGYTQKQLALKLEISDSTVRMWELGKSEPSFDRLTELADVLWTSIDYLLGRVLINHFMEEC